MEMHTMRLSTFDFRLSTLAVAALAAATAFAADAPKNPQDLLRELQNAQRDKKVALDVVTNAYQTVTACTSKYWRNSLCGYVHFVR